MPRDVGTGWVGVMPTPPASAPAAAPASVSTRTAARVVGVVAALLGLAEAGLGVAVWVATDGYTGESSTASLGYVVALLIGVPGALGLLLGVLGWILAHRALALVASLLGLMAGLSPLLLWASFALGI